MGISLHSQRLSVLDRSEDKKKHCKLMILHYLDLVPSASRPAQWERWFSEGS